MSATNTMSDFWARVEKTDGCWLWPTKSVTGYGTWTGGGRNYIVHRLAWELTNGPIPEGLTLDHLCRNRACINPAHLEPVTQRVNALRGIGPSALNAKKTHCHNGHPFTPENTYLLPRDGGRDCRTCRRASNRAYYARQHS